LGLRELGGGHLAGDNLPILDEPVSIRTIRQVRDSEIDPHVCEHIVLRHTVAVVVQGAETSLGGGIALLGGTPIPFLSLCEVLGHAPALVV
jgi:hypothetical protein